MEFRINSKRGETAKHSSHELRIGIGSQAEELFGAEEPSENDDGIQLLTPQRQLRVRTRIGF